MEEQQIEPGAPLEAFSCLNCRQRKVKCDRRNPCSNCLRVARPCSFVAPVRGKRKKRKPTKEGLHAKLQRYEQLLRSYGANIESDTHGEISDEETVSDPDVEMADDTESHLKIRVGNLQIQDSKSKLIHQNGSLRYFENGLWSNLGFRDAFPETEQPALADRTYVSDDQISDPFVDSHGDAGLVLGTYAEMEDLAKLHPMRHILERMWDIYINRVDPMLKILHVPTFRHMLETAIQNPHDVPKSQEAVIFAFYLAITNSLQDDECRDLLEEPKSIATSRYKLAARQALVSAGFINAPSLMTLQAFVIFLLGMSGHFQSNSLFVLAGVAVRLARRIGLHRDGTSLGLSPFDTEMRRRLWWQIVRIDCHISEFSGSKPSMDLFMGDTKMTTNVEDEDLSPDMISPPPERVGITSVALCTMRCDIMNVLFKAKPGSSYDYYWNSLNDVSISLSEKDVMIRQVEEMLETKYLRYCDPSIPLHYLMSVVSRSVICKMKLFAHNPRQFADRGIKIPQKERDLIFTNAVKLLEYGNMIQSNPALKKFMWMMSSGYLWDTLLYVLIELRQRKTTRESEETWPMINELILKYPQMFEEASEALYIALGKWTLQVWDECVAARQEEGLPELPRLKCIDQIRQGMRPWADITSKGNGQTKSGRAITSPASSGSVPSLTQDGSSETDLELGDSYDFSNLLSFDLEPKDWAQWERLFAGQDFG